MTEGRGTSCSTPDRCSEQHSYGPGCLLASGRSPSSHKQPEEGQ